MKQLTSNDKISVPCYATIGFFDGVHLGHQFLLNELKTKAKQCGLESLVVSFCNHPQSYLHPKKEPKLLSTNEEKINLIQQLGIDNCLLLDFDKNIARMTAQKFLIFLKEHYNVHKMLIGYDHHFGSDLKTTNQYIEIGEKTGIKIVSCPSAQKNGTIVSSSKIRNLLIQGNVTEANQLLGYAYALSGRVTHGNQIGRQIGFPTANIEVSTQKIIPANGVYATDIILDNHCFKGMTNIGTRPTIDGKSKTIEVHLFNFNKDIYGKEITLNLHKFIRNEMKFNSLELLKKQLEKDKIQINS